MTYKLVKVINEVGHEVAGLRWNSESKAIYCWKMQSRRDYRFATGVKSETNQLDKATLNKVTRIINSHITEDLRRDEREKKIRPLIGDVMADILKRYESKKRTDGRKSHTYNTVKSSFAKLEPFWASKYPEDLTAKNWDAYQDWFHENFPGQNAFNVTKYMRVIRRELLELGYLKNKPTIENRKKREEEIQRLHKKDWVYTFEEILAIDGACDNDTDLLIVRNGYQNGWRIEESCGMEWTKINFAKKTYHWSGFDNKAELRDVTPLSDDVIEVLKRLPKTHERWVTPSPHGLDAPITTQTFGYRLKGILERAKVSRGTFHALRHFRLSCDFKNPNFTAFQVILMRRVSLETAKKYVHSDQRDLDQLRNSGSIATLKASLSEIKK